MSNANRRYLTCAETAKLVRQALKESFPGVKFSVKSSTYSMGASISVRWTDGPNTHQVEQVTSQFNAAYFDSSIDYKGSRYHTLDGESVRFGADSIHCQRDRSNALVERAIRYTANKYGVTTSGVTAETYLRGGLWNQRPIGEYGKDWQDLIHDALARLTDRLAIASSATLKRVTFAGDDGYGAGTVGTGQGGDQCAKARHQLLEDQAQRDQLRNATPVGGVQ